MKCLQAGLVATAELNASCFNIDNRTVQELIDGTCGSQGHLLLAHHSLQAL